MTNIHFLSIHDCQVTDLGPLLTNAAQGGLGPGDIVVLDRCPLSAYAQTIQLPALRDTYGVTVL
jgi:hypothetical protein